MSGVLLTCAGQRVDIVTAFRRAGAVTVAADLSPLAPALYHADHYVIPPPVTDADYLARLAETAAEHDVDLVVPLTDLDMTLLAERRAELGALLLLPEAAVVERTNDKYRAHVFLQEHGIGSPAGWLPDELPDEVPFPVLIKSRWGFGSRDIFLARNRVELEFFLVRAPAPSFVQAVCAGDEFSIDVFCDLDGRCLNAIPRTMIESKGGESIKGMTVRDEGLVELGRHVSEVVGAVGPATIQCFRTAPGRHEVTDVNLRFGGAFPLPLAAGGSYPSLALALSRGERPEPRVGAFREGIVMTRFFSHVCLTAGDGGELEALPAEVEEPVRRDD
jgi:carbamoyl-phosphate synthase large subunit